MTFVKILSNCSFLKFSIFINETYPNFILVILDKIPDRNSYTPGNLSADRPIMHHFQPLQDLFFIPFGEEFYFLFFYNTNHWFFKFFHFDKPVRNNCWLKVSSTLITDCYRMRIIFINFFNLPSILMILFTSKPCRFPASKSLGSCAGVILTTPVPNFISTISSSITLILNLPNNPLTSISFPTHFCRE